MENLKPNDQRAKNAIILIWAVFFMEIVNLLSESIQLNLLLTANDGGIISEETASANDLRQQACGIIYAIVFITSGVMFIMWFRRAYFNLHTKVLDLSCGEGWAAGAWFVPILGLYRPYQIMKELYERTEILLVKGLENYTARTKSKYLGWWWFLWITSNILGQIVFRTARNADTISELLFNTTMSMIDSFVGIPLALITIKIIKDYSSIEPLLFELKPEGSTEEKSAI